MIIKNTYGLFVAVSLGIGITGALWYQLNKSPFIRGENEAAIVGAVQERRAALMEWDDTPIYSAETNITATSNAMIYAGIAIEAGQVAVSSATNWIVTPDNIFTERKFTITSSEPSTGVFYKAAYYFVALTNQLETEHQSRFVVYNTGGTNLNPNPICDQIVLQFGMFSSAIEDPDNFCIFTPGGINVEFAYTGTIAQVTWDVRAITNITEVWSIDSERNNVTPFLVFTNIYKHLSRLRAMAQGQDRILWIDGSGDSFAALTNSHLSSRQWSWTELPPYTPGDPDGAAPVTIYEQNASNPAVVCSAAFKTISSIVTNEYNVNNSNNLIVSSLIEYPFAYFTNGTGMATHTPEFYAPYGGDASDYNQTYGETDNRLMPSEESIRYIQGTKGAWWLNSGLHTNRVGDYLYADYWRTNGTHVNNYFLTTGMLNHALAMCTQMVTTLYYAPVTNLKWVASTKVIEHSYELTNQSPETVYASATAAIGGYAVITNSTTNTFSSQIAFPREVAWQQINGLLQYYNDDARDFVKTEQQSENITFDPSCPECEDLVENNYNYPDYVTTVTIDEDSTFGNRRVIDAALPYPSAWCLTNKMVRRVRAYAVGAYGSTAIELPPVALDVYKAGEVITVTTNNNSDGLPGTYFSTRTDTTTTTPDTTKPTSFGTDKLFTGLELSQFTTPEGYENTGGKWSKTTYTISPIATNVITLIYDSGLNPETWPLLVSYGTLDNTSPENPESWQKSVYDYEYNLTSSGRRFIYNNFGNTYTGTVESLVVDITDGFEEYKVDHVVGIMQLLICVDWRFNHLQNGSTFTPSNYVPEWVTANTNQP